MKKIIVLLLAIFVLGCNYIEQPETLLKDPHFADYQNKRDKLESRYLDKQITYAEYIQQRDILDAKYDKEVAERNDIINE